MAAPKFDRRIIAGLAGCMFAGLASGAIVTQGCAMMTSCTLAELTAGGYIAIDGAIFDDFTVSSSGIDFGDITVSALGLGLKFGPTNGVGSIFEKFSAENYNVFGDIRYSVSDTVGYIGASNLTVRYGDYRFVGGVFLAGGLDAFLERDGGQVADVVQRSRCIPDDIGGCFPTLDNKAFGGVRSINVHNSLFIRHESSGAGADGMQILGFNQTFARVIPEPNSLSAGLLALCAAGLARRRSSKQTSTEAGNRAESH